MPNTLKYSRSDGKKPPCIRSSWMRSIITTSASRDRLARRRSSTCTPSRLDARPASASAGRRPRPRRPAWSAGSAFERSTRLCSRSPTMATFRPARRPLCSRIVKASSSACVGCSCMPSPALMMPALQTRDSRWHAPDDAWRITMMSGAIASRFSAVSISVSPLTTLDCATARLSVSALRRFSAISNDVRVRVRARRTG